MSKFIKFRHASNNKTVLLNINHISRVEKLDENCSEIYILERERIIVNKPIKVVELELNELTGSENAQQFK